MSRELRPLTAIPHPIAWVIHRLGVSLPKDVLLRQVQFSTTRPTKLDKIKNLRNQVFFVGVIGHTSPTAPNANSHASTDEAGAFFGEPTAARKRRLIVPKQHSGWQT